MLGQVVHAAEVLDDDSFDSQVVAPDLCDEFGIVAALDVDAAGAGDPGPRTRHRDGAGGRSRAGRGGRTSRGGEYHRPTVQQIPGPQRKATGVTVPVFQVDAAVFDSHDRADVAGLHVLDDHVELNRVLSR